YTPNKGTAWSTVGTIKDPSAAAAFTGPQTIKFAVDASGKTTYSVLDSSGAPVNDPSGNPMTGLAYKSGDAIRVGGMDVVITGAPANNDGFT
ncbi:hypothetical protein Q0P46_13740, partial [Staphylococcus aureus]|nr:hypothetical protein [Staphylococcus aureus]